MRLERASLILFVLLITSQLNIAVSEINWRSQPALSADSPVETAFEVNATSTIGTFDMSIGMNDYGPDITGLYGDVVAYDLFRNWSAANPPSILRTWCAFGSQLGYDLGYGYRHVIFNGTTFEDALSPAFYNWTYLDILSNVTASIGARWLLTFTGCPISLSRGGGPIDPPKNVTVYAEVVAHVVRHYLEGWPDNSTRSHNFYYAEIGNEPNLSAFWNGTQAEFFELYGNVSLRLRELYPHMRIGGPGLAHTLTEWAPTFLTYVKDKNLPLDFFSWHCYDDNSSKIVDAMIEGKKTVKAYGFQNTLLIFDEWGKSLNNDTGWDTMETALHAANVLIGGAYTGLDATCFAMAKDARIAYNHPLWGWEANFGLLTLNSTPKPIYYSLDGFQRIRSIFGPSLLNFTSTSETFPAPDLKLMATMYSWSMCSHYWRNNLDLMIVNNENRPVNIRTSFMGLPSLPLSIRASELSQASISSGENWVTKQNVVGELPAGGALSLELSPQSITRISASMGGEIPQPIDTILMILTWSVLAVVEVILVAKWRRHA